MRIIFRFILLSAGLLTACADDAADSANSGDLKDDSGIVSAQESVIQVKTIALQHESFTPVISLVGAIQAAEEIALSVNFSAPIKQVLVREGQAIQRGDTLLVLDDEKLQLQLTQARQMLEQSRSRLQEAQENLKRREDLAEKNTLSKELLDAARHEWHRASSAVKEAEAAKSLAQRDLKDTKVTSPVNGVIDEGILETGETVQPGQQLVLIQATGSLEVKTFISERDIHVISEGNHATLRLSHWPQKLYHAMILSIGVAADLKTGNFPLTLLINDADKTLRVGMTTDIEIQGDTMTEVLIIPESALVDYDRQQAVFVVKNSVVKNGVANSSAVNHKRAEVRRPQLHVGLGDRVKVLAGLVVGEQLVVRADRALVDGVQVEVISQ